MPSPEGPGMATGGEDADTVRAAASSKGSPTVYACRADPVRDGTGPAAIARLRGSGSMLWRRTLPWLSRAVTALLPCACELCGAVQDQPVCAGCERDLLPPRPRCPGCALPHLRTWRADEAGHKDRNAAGAEPGLCLACQAAPHDFDAATALGDYAPPADSLVLGLKYGARLALADWMALRLAERVQRLPPVPPVLEQGPRLLVAPVPLGGARLAERGFNQSWEIARRLARRLRLPACATLLVRARETQTQTALAPAGRHSNVAGAFAIAPWHRVDGAHVLLVDDVMTTGATLSAAALALKRRGAARITAIVALRTPAPWQRTYAGAPALVTPPARTR
ncbi:ComF family protein [Paracidovorax citrulli]